MPRLDPGLVARARGLATRLIARHALESLAEADDPGAFARALARQDAAMHAIGDPPDVFAVQRAIEQNAHRHVETLRRWQRRRPGVLDVVDAQQDRRSLRALLRGAAQGAAPDARLDGLMPTPSLPRRILAALARLGTPAAVVGMLSERGHPDASRLLPLVRSATTNLLAVDIALLRGFADRARAASASGDEPLRDFVSGTIDAGNAQTAIVLAGEPRDLEPAEVFVDGGRSLSRGAFIAAAESDSRERALARLRTAARGSPMTAWLPAVAADLIHLDRLFAVAAMRRLTRAARVEPLGSAPVLQVLLRIDAQSRDLRALAWGAQFGTPAPLRRQELITPR